MSHRYFSVKKNNEKIQREAEKLAVNAIKNHRYYRRRKKASKLRYFLTAFLIVVILLAGLIGYRSFDRNESYIEAAQNLFTEVKNALLNGGKIELTGGEFDLADVPQWDGKRAYVAVNDNVPYFTAEDVQEASSTVYIHYSGTDYLGRSRSAMASLNVWAMPSEDRDDDAERSSIYPTGFKQATYSTDLVENGYLYNRCHLIGWQLGGETIYENIVTGTRSMNIAGMLPYENEVARYIRSHPDNHVLYRATPIYQGENLLCDAVLMEAYSVEDQGILHFCVYVYNEQPGIFVRHSDGESYEL